MNNKKPVWLLVILVVLMCIIVICCAVTVVGWQMFSAEDGSFFEEPINGFEDESTGVPDSGGPSLPPPKIGSGQFRDADCPFPGNFERVRCGYLDVPEDRQDLNSPTISLAVAILSSESGGNDSVPLIYLEGGPGGSALDGLDYLWLNSPLGESRDIILLDQRGTGYSQPTLNCPELEEDSVRDWYEALLDCRERLEDSGINLNMYNSAQSAADVADLRLALGHEQVDILGISYGTRLALTVMRDHPEGIRSVILDSVYPPHVDALTQQPLTTLRALEHIFDGCRADSGCNQVYPDLESVLYELVADLNQNPATVLFYDEELDEDYEEEVWGDDVVYTIFDSMYDTRVIPYLPAFIYTMYQGDYEEAYEILEIPYDFLDPDSEGDYLLPEEDVSDSEGMFYSVECYEEVYFNSAAEAESGVNAYPSTITEGLIWEIEDFFYSCDLWGVSKGPQVENQPVRSSVPTLVLNGEYDPVTPAEWADETADYLSNSQLFIFFGYGHAVIDGGSCPVELILDFLGDPTSLVDDSCMSEVDPPDFVENP